MVLVDTSIWISHFRNGNPELATLLNDGKVLCHPLVVGELACGNLKDRNMILSFLQLLPMATTVEHEEVLSFIEDNRLMGLGLGYIDIHLIMSAVLTEAPIWTLDKKLSQIADKIR